MDLSLDQNYWNQRYLTDDTPWNIGLPSEALKSYFDQLEDKDIKILIPGAGHAHEAIYLAENGFNHVYVCDFSVKAIENLQNKIKNYPSIRLIQKDFFELDDLYDLIVEQTFFCALEPKFRENYITKMFNLLKPNAKLIGLLFNKEFEKKGPPFGGKKSDYNALFSSQFEIIILEECNNSISPRSGNELFFICKKPK
jgi:thiopurine S-methyltransferase